MTLQDEVPRSIPISMADPSFRALHCASWFIERRASLIAVFH